MRNKVAGKGLNSCSDITASTVVMPDTTVQMSSERERYSKLAPLGVELRTKLAISAVNFFGPLAYKDNCTVLGKTPDPKAIRPLGSSDFVDYLQKKGILDEPMRYVERIRQLLERLSASGILIEMGQSSNVMLPKLYYCLKELDRQ